MAATGDPMCAKCGNYANICNCKMWYNWTEPSFAPVEYCKCNDPRIESYTSGLPYLGATCSICHKYTGDRYPTYNNTEQSFKTLMNILKLELKVKKTHPDAIIPTKTNDTDSGYDLYSLRDYQIFPHYEGQGVVMIETGISVEFPDGYAGLIFDRSGMGSKGFSTFGGVIDNQFRGPICVLLAKLTAGKEFKLDSEPYVIKKGDRVAQLIIHKVKNLKIVEVDSLSETDRGEKGFNSSGN